jgi:hypothetical protein
MFGRLFGAPVPPALSVMPTFRTSLAQGFVVVASNPVLVIACFLLVLAVWSALLALGYVGAPFTLAQTFALPPLSIAFDTQNAVSIAGQRTGVIAGLGLLIVRAIVVSLLSAAIVVAFEQGGRVSTSATRRAFLAYPRVLASCVLGYLSLFFTQLGQFLPAGIGLLAQVVLPTFVLYLLGFVPFIAVRRRTSLPDTLRLSVAGARTPGGRHLSFCILYVLMALFLAWFLPDGSYITASPSVATWIGILAMTVLHLGFTAALGYRWLAVERTTAGEPPADAASADEAPADAASAG